MEVFVYRGLSAVPSIDLDCQRIIAYITRCQAPVRINKSGNPFHSPNGLLPYLLVENGEKIAGYENIVVYLNDLGNFDKYALKPSRSIEGLSQAYIFYLRDHLEPCLQYFLWGDPQNAENTRLMYAKRTPFPYSFYYPQKYIKYADLMMQTLKQFSTEDKLENHETQTMIVDAMKTLNQLESKLGDKITFLGVPCELDCTMYAYLSIILHVLPHNNVLRNHLMQCNLLVRFVTRFKDSYLTSVIQPNTDKTEEQRLNGTGTTTDIDDKSSKWVAKLLAASIAVGAMSLFALKQGIFNASDDSMYDMQYADDDDDEDGGGGDDN